MWVNNATIHFVVWVNEVVLLTFLAISGRGSGVEALSTNCLILGSSILKILWKALTFFLGMDGKTYAFLFVS